MSKVVILNLALLEVRPGHTGTVQLARFDAEIGGLRLEGCRLLRNSAGIHSAKPPKTRTARGEGRASIWFTDTRLLWDFIEQAFAAFEAKTGIVIPRKGH